jgi:hypothetical protein
MEPAIIRINNVELEFFFMHSILSIILDEERIKKVPLPGGTLNQFISKYLVQLF